MHPIDLSAVETLGMKLQATAGGAPGEALSEGERALVVAALAQVAADQAVIVRLRRLLALHEESGERLDEMLAEGARAAREALGATTPSAGYDFEAAREAREALADAVSDARSGSQVIAAALGFVREMAALL